MKRGSLRPRASRMAATVSGFGTSGSKGSAFSRLGVFSSGPAGKTSLMLRPSRSGCGHYLAALKFVCRRCGGRRYRVRIVADSLGEPEPLKMQHFRGVYEKFLD